MVGLKTVRFVAVSTVFALSVCFLVYFRKVSRALEYLGDKGMQDISTSEADINYSTSLEEVSAKAHSPTGEMKKYLSFPLDGGLTNQRIRLKRGLMMGLVTSRTVYLPPWVHVRKHFVADWHGEKAGWTQVPLSDLYDIPYLRSCAQKLGLDVAESCIPDDCPIPPSMILTTHFTGSLHSNFPLWENELHVSQQYPPEFVLERRDVTMAEAMDSCITYAGNVLKAATLTYSLLQRYFSVDEAAQSHSFFIGLHLRLEPDGVAFWGGSVKEEDFLVRTLDRISLCFNAHITPIANLSEDTREICRVYVASGLPSASQEFIRLEQHLPCKFVSKDDLWAQQQGIQVGQGNAPWQEWGADMQAAVDQILLAQSSFFIGFDESTFSIQVAQERLRRGRPSALHNNAMVTEGECPVFTQFTKW